MEFSFKRISCVEGIRVSFAIIHTLIDMIDFKDMLTLKGPGSIP